MKHFLTTTDWSPGEISAFLAFAKRVKSGEVVEKKAGKILGMLFFNSSLRTRMSFEAAMFNLGGHAIYLAASQDLWNIEMRENVVMDGAAAEHIKEAAPVMSRYVHAIAVRSFPKGEEWSVDKTDPVLSAFARYSDVPVINMESCLWHPCQALADALTWNDYNIKRGDKIVLTWAYHPKALPMAVPNSVAAMAAQRGLKLTIQRPEEFALDKTIMESLKRIAAETGGSVVESSSTNSLEGAKIVYAKSWGSLTAYGKTDDEKNIRKKYIGWQVTAEWMKRTDNAKFMHCLPVRRNVLAADNVLDSKASIVVDQAENRLHVQQALLLKLL